MDFDQNNEITEAMFFDIIMENSQDTIYFKDKDSRFIANSMTHVQQFGFTDPAEMIGKSDFDFFPEDFAKAARQDELEIMRTGKPILGKIESVISNGEKQWFLVCKYPIVDKRTGEIIGIWGISRDITEMKRIQEELDKTVSMLADANERLQRASDIDGLSDLFNQKCFLNNLSKEMKYYEEKQADDPYLTFSVILLDIDGFKLINDRYGHPMGDRVIRFVADLLRENTRDEDECYRYGGDEFAVILRNTDIATAYIMAERLRKRIETSQLCCNDELIRCTVSIGVGNYEGETTLEELLEKVDSKLYVSKKHGKNQVNF